MKFASALFASAALAGSMFAADPFPTKTATYRVEQNATLSDIPAGARRVKFWVSIPDNDRYQDVLDFEAVPVPGKWSVVRDPERGNRFMLVEVDQPGTDKLTAKVAFTVRRTSVFTDID